MAEPSLGEGYTLKSLAMTGYALGLTTINEVANHMRSHYDVYFFIEKLSAQMDVFDALVRGHEGDSVDAYLTAEEKAQYDRKLNEYFEKHSVLSSDQSETQEVFDPL